MAGEEMIRIAVSELERLISTKNVVGEPVAMGDRVMIPISGYGFGFGGGSGQGHRGRGSGRRRAARARGSAQQRASLRSRSWSWTERSAAPRACRSIS